MKLLEGKAIAGKILREVKKEIKSRGIKPGLAVVLVGNDPASELYVNLKSVAARKAGIKFNLVRFSEKAGEKSVIATIKKLNADGQTHGIIVQLPLPEKFHTQKIINTVDLKKDVDGLHTKSHRGFLAGKPGVYPTFPLAIMKMVESINTCLKGKKAVIIANSKGFGMAMRRAFELKKASAEYILSKDFDKNIGKLEKADVLVTAVGKPGLIKGEMLKKGVVVVDGGISKKGSKVLGDVDFDSVKNVASFLSPVPDGVGPVTIACLLQNVVNLSTNSIKAVIFDMDGVISDTQRLHSDVESKMFKEYGIDISPEEITAKFAGIPDFVYTEDVFKKYGVQVDLDEVIADKWQEVTEIMQKEIIPVPGVQELIEELHSKYKLAVGSSSIAKFVNIALEKLNIRDKFDAVVTIDDVKNGKPDPEIFLLAAKKLGVKPEECVVIEDGRSGMQAAKAAGMKCIGLVKDKTSKDYPADILVESLSEIDISIFNNGYQNR